MNKIHECNDICVEHYNESEVKCPYCLEFGSDTEYGKTNGYYSEAKFMVRAEELENHNLRFWMIKR